MAARRAAAAALMLALTAAGCGSESEVGDTEPVAVEVGEPFSWNGFEVLEGWTLDSVEATVGGERVQQPVVRGDVKNLGDESRFALFELVFVQEGEALVSVSCSSSRISPDDNEIFNCPGIGKTFPSGYDEVQVQELVRE